MAVVACVWLAINAGAQVGIAVTAVVTICLGVASYVPCRDTQSWVSLAVWVASLFAIQVETLVIGPGAAVDVVCHGPYPLTLQVARLFGFAAIAFTAFAIVFSLVQSHIDHFFLSLRGEADIVTGLNVDSLPLVGALAPDRAWDRLRHSSASFLTTMTLSRSPGP